MLGQPYKKNLECENFVIVKFSIIRKTEEQCQQGNRRR